MIQDFQVTPNFKLYELLHSDTATRNHIEEQWNPSREVIDNLTHLAVNVLQPLRNALGKPFYITCAYRCPSVNKSVGGAQASQHLIGQAADCVYSDGNLLLAKTILEAHLPFDQIILEGGTLERPNWIHVSYSERNRREILRADFTSGTAVYSHLTSEAIVKLK